MMIQKQKNKKNLDAENSMSGVNCYIEEKILRNMSCLGNSEKIAKKILKVVGLPRLASHRCLMVNIHKIEFNIFNIWPSF